MRAITLPGERAHHVEVEIARRKLRRLRREEKMREARRKCRRDTQYLRDLVDAARRRDGAI